jgi:hypothetical protein
MRCGFAAGSGARSTGMPRWRSVTRHSRGAQLFTSPAGGGRRPQGRRVGNVGKLAHLRAALTPPRAPVVRYPPPAGEGKQNRSRGAIAPEFSQCRSPDERQRNPGPAFKFACRSRISLSLSSGRPLRAGSVGSSALQMRREAERRQTQSSVGRTPTFILPRLRGEDKGGGAARVRRDALACRRSTAALA